MRKLVLKTPTITTQEKGILHCLYRGPARGGSHIALLNFKMSRVGGQCYKCLMSLSEIEQKFFVFVGILAKGDGDAL